MAASGEVKGEAVRRIVSEIVVTYRLEEDPKGEYRRFTLRHEGEGQVVDGLIWSEPLVTKLAYAEADGRCTPVTTSPGKGWMIDFGTTRLATEVRTDCVWIHDETCMWWELCTE